MKINPASDEFLQTYEWRRLRMEVLKRDGARCACCGATPKNGAVMNVDHIKPRKTHPELALDGNNCQVLCNACNQGKGNWDDTTWRDPIRRPERSQVPSQNAAGPYLAMIRYVLQRPKLALEFRTFPPKFPSREAEALDALLAYILINGLWDKPAEPIVEALSDTEFAAVYRRTMRLIADLGDTGEDEATFRDGLKVYQDFEMKFARQRGEHE